MINLNDPRFIIKEFVTEDALFSIINDYDIYNYYIEDLRLNKGMSSPLRKDSSPSFSVFWSNKYNRILWKDHGDGNRGGAVRFVSELLGLNYREALEQIVLDFKLDDRFKISSDLKRFNGSNPQVHNKDLIKNIIDVSVVIRIKSRPYMAHDIRFWSSYGISEETLRKYNVIPIEYLFINGNVYGVDRYAYAYVEYKDDETRYKIYQPFNIKIKWLSNLIEGTLSGWSQMADTGDLLIISSSLKDGMCLHDYGFKNFIAPQTENYIFKPHIVEDLKSRFKNILVFYDHDVAGINAANKMNLLYGFKFITTNSEELKDPSDYYKNKGTLWDILHATT